MSDAYCPTPLELDLIDAMQRVQVQDAAQDLSQEEFNALMDTEAGGLFDQWMAEVLAEEAAG